MAKRLLAALGHVLAVLGSVLLLALATSPLGLIVLILVVCVAASIAQTSKRNAGKAGRE